MKSERQRLILKLIECYDIETQEELMARLAEHGIESKQTTISRDIKELYLYKEPCGDGRTRYTVSGNANSADIDRRLYRILSECVLAVDHAGLIVLIKTIPGLADAAGAAMDGMHPEGMVGCIGGNDTVAIIARSEQAAADLCAELKRFCK